MSEVIDNPAGAEAAAAATKTAKAKTVYNKVLMKDGRTVEFPGDRKVSKEVVAGEDGKATGVRFDFVNGETRGLALADLTDELVAYASCHGLLQKIGDEWSGVKEIDDIVLTADEIIGRLAKGSWDSENRGTGDSMAGASLVIQALVTASKEKDPNGVGKTASEIKAALDARLEQGKADGLTRQKLYASFRNPTSRVGQIIRELEDAKAAKNAAISADDFVAGLTA